VARRVVARYDARVSDTGAMTLAESLRTRGDAVLASWTHRFERSPLRFQRAVEAKVHAGLMVPMIEALAVAVTGSADDLRPGRPLMRELERASSFAGARMATTGVAGFDVAAALFALRDASVEFAAADQAGSLGELFEWLVVIALDAFATAGTQSVREKAAEHLEHGMPVVQITPEVPAVLLVGDPPPAVLDSVLARSLLLVVGSGARTLILDQTGLADPSAPPVVEAIERLFAHRRMGQVQIALVSAAGEARTAWSDVGARHGVEVVGFDRFDAAFAHAVERAKHRG
jgi:hypothetical protein